MSTNELKSTFPVEIVLFNCSTCIRTDRNSLSERSSICPISFGVACVDLVIHPYVSFRGKSKKVDEMQSPLLHFWYFDIGVFVTGENRIVLIATRAIGDLSYI